MTDWHAEAQARGRALEALDAELRAALAPLEGWAEMSYSRGLFVQKWGGAWDDPAYTERHLRAIPHNGKDLTPSVCATKYRRGTTLTDEIHAPTVAEALAWIATPRSDTSVVERLKAAEMAALEAAAAPKRVDLGGLEATVAEAGLNAKRQPFQVLDVAGLGRVRITLAGPDLLITLNRRRTTVPDPGREQRPAAVRAAAEALARR